VTHPIEAQEFLLYVSRFLQSKNGWYQIPFRKEKIIYASRKINCMSEGEF